MVLCHAMMILLIFLSLLYIFGKCEETVEQTIPTLEMRVRYRGISRLKEDVFYERHSPSWLDCGTTCLQTSVCQAYNYKENFKDGEINCQLTHIVNHSVFEKVSTEDNDWTFYEVAEERMCTLEDPYCCQNGGTLVLDSENSFKCKCQERYVGDWCETERNFTCTLLKSKNHTLSDGFYVINTGAPHLPTFSVYCNMVAKDEIGVTEIGHDSEEEIEATGNEAGKPYYGRNITYEISMDKIVAVINQSKYCEQFIKYRCYYSWLLKNNYGWWVSRQGKRMNYWGGAAVDSGKCACGMTNTCAGGQPLCNCDAGIHEFREDSGFLTDMNTLPVTVLRFGDTDRSSEQGFHTLGKLRCWG